MIVIEFDAKCTCTSCEPKDAVCIGNPNRIIAGSHSRFNYCQFNRSSLDDNSNSSKVMDARKGRERRLSVPLRRCSQRNVVGSWF